LSYLVRAPYRSHYPSPDERAARSLSAIRYAAPDPTMPRKISAFAPLAIGILLPRWGGAQARQDTIPFVGCPADGQAGPIEAPTGPPTGVAGTEVPASRLAYYKGEEAPGLFGPRGWHCRVWYGSSGSTLIITPTVIDSTLGLPRKLQGEALELSVSSGGTSGRFVVAHYAARLFPRVAAKFIARVQNEGLAPLQNFSPDHTRMTQ